MAQRGRTFKHLVSFNAGELSPLLDARVDLDKYQNGCRQLQNAIIETYGAARRRPGLQFIAAAKFANRKCRLLDFQFSTTTNFVLELGHLYLRFFSNAGQVMSGMAPYEIASPYPEEALFQVQLAQINDLVYLTHPSYPPYKLSRIADTNWTLQEVQWKFPPFEDENLTTTTITPSATTGTITLTASAALFTASDEGSYIAFRQVRESTSVEAQLPNNGLATAYAGFVTGSIDILGSWTWRSFGVWDTRMWLERSEDNGVTWEKIREVRSRKDYNFDITGTQDIPAKFRINVDAGVTTNPGSATLPRAVIEANDASITGFVKITAFTNATTVTAEVISPLLEATATKTWSKSSWGQTNGYPRAVTFFEQRLCFGGTKAKPQTIWGSVTSDFENFTTGTADTDSFAYTIAATEQAAVQWLLMQKALLVGTTSGEWAIKGGGDEDALTSTNVLARRQSTYGSRDIQAEVVNDVVLFVQRQGLRVREFTFSFEKDGYVAPNMTVLSEQITESGIVDMAYQQQKEAILWAVTGEGNLIGMTYEREQNVVGWHRHNTQGEFESVATIYGIGSDEVWCSVKRTVNGNDVRYIERFNPVDWEEQADAFFVDSGLSFYAQEQGIISTLTPDLLGTSIVPGVPPTTRRVYRFRITASAAHGLTTGQVVRVLDTGVTGLDGEHAVEVINPTEFWLLKTPLDGSVGPFTSNPLDGGDYSAVLTSDLVLAPSALGTWQRVAKNLTGATHLVGKTVSVLVDGATEPDKVVQVGGLVSLNGYARVAHVGLQYDTIIQPMRLDSDTVAGISQGQVKQIRELVLRLNRSLGLQYGDGKTFRNLSFRATSDLMDQAPPLFTGDKVVEFSGDYDLDVPFVIKQSQPLPLTLLGIVVKYAITGN